MGKERFPKEEKCRRYYGVIGPRTGQVSSVLDDEIVECPSGGTMPLYVDHTRVNICILVKKRRKIYQARRANQ
jgi:hypothetical protein